LSYREILQQALDADVGIGVLCHGDDGADKLRRQLYVERADAREEGLKTFDSLSFSIAPFAHNILFVYKRSQ
jgi:hypothetical protein